MWCKAGGIGGATTNFPTGDLGPLKDKAFDTRFWGACTPRSLHCIGVALTKSFAGALYCVKYSHGNVADSVTFTSGAGVKRPAIPGLVLVAGALGAIMTSTRTLAVDLAPLRFNCIVPGAVNTELLDVRLPLRASCAR
jgi:NAD(P)-dependent dehydrogenase (short-subunit alcohol dehydrogenase family)